MKELQWYLIILVGLVVIAIQYKQAENRNNVIVSLNEKIEQKDSVLVSQQYDIYEMNENFKELLNSLEFISKVDVTMYNAVEGQTDSTPFITASGARIDPTNATEHRWIAISRDLQTRWGGELNFGDVVYIKGTEGYDGLYKVNDNMNARFTNRIDILRTKGDKSFAFVDGNIELYRVQDNGGVMFADGDSKWERLNHYMNSSAR